PDPEDWLRGLARASRLVSEHLAALLRFLQESGDPALLAEYHKVQTRRREQESDLASRLTASGRLRAGLDHDRMWDILWLFSGTPLRTTRHPAGLDPRRLRVLAGRPADHPNPRGLNSNQQAAARDIDPGRDRYLDERPIRNRSRSVRRQA